MKFEYNISSLIPSHIKNSYRYEHYFLNIFGCVPLNIFYIRLFLAKKYFFAIFLFLGFLIIFCDDLYSHFATFFSILERIHNLWCMQSICFPYIIIHEYIYITTDLNFFSLLCGLQFCFIDTKAVD